MTAGYLRRLPIRAKLVAMTMITSATVLVLASAGYLFWDYYRLRADMQSELGAQANLVLENSSAALSFENQRDAASTLETLETVPRLRTACLYNQRGELFADLVPHRFAGDLSAGVRWGSRQLQGRHVVVGGVGVHGG